MSVKAALRATWPTARSMAWGPTIGAAIGMTAVTAASRPWDGHGLTLWSTRLVACLVALGTAFAVEDGAAVTTASSPMTLAARRAVRVGLALTAFAAVVGLALGAVALMAGDGDLPWSRALLETAGIVTVAFTCTLAVGADRAAVLVLGAFLGALVVQQRFPQYALFPEVPGGEAWGGAGTAWVVIVVAAAVAACALSRDAAGISLRRRAGAARRGGPQPSCTPSR